MIEDHTISTDQDGAVVGAPAAPPPLTWADRDRKPEPSPAIRVPQRPRVDLGRC